MEPQNKQVHSYQTVVACMRQLLPASLLETQSTCSKNLIFHPRVVPADANSQELILGSDSDAMPIASKKRRKRKTQALFRVTTNSSGSATSVSANWYVKTILGFSMRLDLQQRLIGALKDDVGSC